MKQLSSIYIQQPPMGVFWDRKSCICCLNSLVVNFLFEASGEAKYPGVFSNIKHFNKAPKTNF